MESVLMQGAVAIHSTQQVKELNTGALDETCPKRKYVGKKTLWDSL